MTANSPSPVDRPLTPEEKTLLNVLAISVVAKQTHCDHQDAAVALDQIVDEDGMYFDADAYNVWLRIGRPGDGRKHQTLVHATREFLAFHANHPDQPVDLDRYGVVIREEDESTEDESTEDESNE